MPAASAAGQNRLLAVTKPTPASAARTLGLSPHTSSRIPGPTKSGSVCGAAREHMEPVIAAVAVGHRVDDLEARAVEDRNDVVTIPPREESAREVVAGERPFAVAGHEREVRGRRDRERLLELHERPREPSAWDVQVAGACPRAAERARAGTAAPRGRRGFQATSGAVSRASTTIAAAASSATAGRGEVRQVQARSAPEVGGDRRPRHSELGDLPSEPLDAIEEPRPTVVAPFFGARLVHRDRLLLHPRIIAAMTGRPR